MADAILAQVGIYAITNNINGKRYIGSAVDVARRWRAHKYRLNRGTHHSIKLQNSWNKHGQEAFLFEVIELVEDVGILIEREQDWITKSESTGSRGYNICATAGSRLGVPHSDEAKAKIARASTGKKHSAESIARMRMAQKGKVISAETAAKIGAAAKGRVPSPDALKKRAESGKISKGTPEARAKVSKQWAGIKKSPEHVAKIRAARIAGGGWIVTPEATAKRLASRAANKLAKSLSAT